MITCWQHIPFCVDVIARLRPGRVLDIGGRGGRNAALVREHAAPGDAPRVEALNPASGESERAVYDAVHAADPLGFLQSLDPFDLIIIENTLEFAERSKGIPLLVAAMDRAAYVLLTIPIDRDLSAQPLGANQPVHQSAWTVPDFIPSDPLRREMFRDALGGPFATFLFSRHDPAGLRHTPLVPFSPSQPGPLDSGTQDELDRLLTRAADQAFELDFIKRTRPYRLARALRSAAAVRGLARWRGDTLTIRALGQPGHGSQGSEVWVLGIAAKPDGKALPWDYLMADEDWQVRAAADRPHGRCLLATGEATLRARLGQPDPEVRFLGHAWSGQVRVEYKGRAEVIDLHHAASDVIRVFPGRTPMVGTPVLPSGPHTLHTVPTVSAANVAIPRPPVAPALPRPFTPFQQTFIERVRAESPPAIAVTCPAYLGVTSSTVNLFDHTYFMPETRGDDPAKLTAEDLEHHARVLAETRCPRVVFSGGDERQHHVMQRLRAMRPDVRCDLFLHASYPQFCEDHSWMLFKLWVDSARAGELYSIASAKAGFDRFVQSLGIRGSVLLNRVNLPMMPMPTLPESPRRVGMWLSGTTYRKIPHAMLAAVKMMPDTVLDGAGIAGRAKEVIEYLQIPTGEVQDKQLPHADLFERVRRTHLTLYVTFIECCPMLPLESLHHGVPCLLGPNSHLFQDNPYLFERLVVPFPDRAEVIANYALRAINEREHILAAYRGWHAKYSEQAEQALSEVFHNAL